MKGHELLNNGLVTAFSIQELSAYICASPEERSDMKMPLPVALGWVKTPSDFARYVKKESNLCITALSYASHYLTDKGMGQEVDE